MPCSYCGADTHPLVHAYPLLYPQLYLCRLCDTFTSSNNAPLER